MAIIGYMESSLGTSEIFKQINELEGGENTLEKAKNLIKNAKRLTNEDIEASYIAVRQVTDTLTRAAMKAFDEEKVVLIYNNNPAIEVTQTLPFITLKTGQGGYNVTYVFVHKYVQISRTGVMSIQPSILRDLLIGAYVANGIRNSYSKLASNTFLMKTMMEIYTEFMIRILNREFAIKADRVVTDTLQYWIGRFFMTRIFGSADSPENIETIARAHFRAIDQLKADEIKMQYDEADPATISQLIELLRSASSRMKTLNIGRFYSDWTNYYYIPSMLALDNVEYLIFMIICLQSGSGIMSISAADIVRECKGIKGFREELLKLT